MPDPWERQPKEPPRAWEGFVAYRDLGLTRSLAKAAEVVGVTRATLGTYSQRWDWVQRAAAWDNEQDRQEQLWVAEERRKAVTRHIRQAQTLQSTWLKRLSTLDPNSLTPAEAIRYAEVATKMEREALQLSGPAVNVQMTGAVGVLDIANLSPTEVAHRLEILQSEVRTRLADAALAQEEEP